MCAVMYIVVLLASAIVVLILSEIQRWYWLDKQEEDAIRRQLEAEQADSTQDEAQTGKDCKE